MSSLTRPLRLIVSLGLVLLVPGGAATALADSEADAAAPAIRASVK
jgi:hypothetical protein